MKWINAREQLPPDKEEVLVFTRGKFVYTGRYMFEYDEWTRDYHSEPIEEPVDYWMPLPEAPE